MEKLPCYIKWFPSRVSMKQVFITSICREGIPGGGIVADGHAITCKTGKVTVSPKPKQILNLISDFRISEFAATPSVPPYQQVSGVKNPGGK